MQSVLYTRFIYLEPKYFDKTAISNYNDKEIRCYMFMI